MSESQSGLGDTVPIAIRLKESWFKHLTGLALLDESVIGDQVRRALSGYLQQPPEADRRLQLRQVVPEDTSEKSRLVTVKIPTEEIAMLGELAWTYSVTQAEHIEAAVNSYLIQRLGDTALPGQAELAIDRIRSELPQATDSNI